MAAVILFHAVTKKEAMAIQETMGLGFWPSAMVLTTAWRDQLVSVTQEEASLDVLRAKTRRSCRRVRREGEESVLDQG